MSRAFRILFSRPPLGGLLALGAAVLLAACGQRGPLYLPSDPAAANRATLPQVLNPVGTPTAPAPSASDAGRGGTGTGTAAPVRTP